MERIQVWDSIDSAKDMGRLHQRRDWRKTRWSRQPRAAILLYSQDGNWENAIGDWRWSRCWWAYPEPWKSLWQSIVWDQKPDDLSEPINYVELKTSKVIQSDRDQVNFERKMMRFWAQSFLLGVPKIIVGLRTNNGVLTDVQEMETHKLPNMAKRSGRKLWDGNVCINFANAVLDWLTECIPETGDLRVWSIRHEENGREVRIVESSEPNFLESGFLKWRLEGA